MAMHGSYNARSVGGAGRGCVAGAPPGEGARIESALLVDWVYERSVWELDVMGRRANGRMYVLSFQFYNNPTQSCCDSTPEVTLA